MPSNIMSFDQGFPTFTGKESATEQIRALHNYMFQLREGLQYSLQNLKLENFNKATLEYADQAQKEEITKQTEPVSDALKETDEKLKKLSDRVTRTEDDINGLEKTTDNLTLEQEDIEKTIQELTELISGEDGVLEHLKALEEVLSILDDESISIGAEGRDLHLLGNVYINGVLFTQGESEQ